MKTDQKIKAGSVIISMCLIGTIFVVNGNLNKTEDMQQNKNELLLSNNILDNTSTIDVEETVTDDVAKATEEVVPETEETTEIEDENKELVGENVQEAIVYDGLTRQQLIDKLNRNLNSTIAGKGELFVDYSLELGIDPYLAVAIVLHETGCSWDCSSLVKYCNNVGGQKGALGCGGGAYASFATLDEGIMRFMDNLYRNYYAYGLTTPETINPKYAASTTWASSINNYINKIKAS